MTPAGSKRELGHYTDNTQTALVCVELDPDSSGRGGGICALIHTLGADGEARCRQSGNHHGRPPKAHGNRDCPGLGVGLVGQ